MRLENKNCVIIGGTSGIGGAIAEAFVREGARVVPVSRRKEHVIRTIVDLKKLGNRWDKPITVDVCDEKSIKNMMSVLKKALKQIDVVVCTAGCHLKKDFLQMTTKEWDEILSTNLRGTFLINKHFSVEMVKQNKGSIINVSSLGAQVALSQATAYSVSKAGVSMLTKSLAVELASMKVRVNALLPGVFPTPLNKKALQDPKRRKRIIERTPLKRMGDVKELTGAAIYLASDESGFVTGTELTVDGGFLASAGF